MFFSIKAIFLNCKFDSFTQELIFWIKDFMKNVDGFVLFQENRKYSTSVFLGYSVDKFGKFRKIFEKGS